MEKRDLLGLIILSFAIGAALGFAVARLFF